jgi:hypothetical protein
VFWALSTGHASVLAMRVGRKFNLAFACLMLVIGSMLLLNSDTSAAPSNAVKSGGKSSRHEYSLRIVVDGFWATKALYE